MAQVLFLLNDATIHLLCCGQRELCCFALRISVAKKRANLEQM